MVSSRFGKVEVVKVSNCTFSSDVHMKEVTANVEWTLNAFSQLAMERIYSHIFNIICKGSISCWYLVLDLGKEEDIGLALHPDTTDSDIVDQKTRTTFSMGNGGFETQFTPEKIGNGGRWRSFVNRNFLLAHCLKNDELLMKATVTVCHCHPDDYQRLSKALMVIRKEEKMNNFIKIQCRGETVETSKELLCTASPTVLAPRIRKLNRTRQATGVLVIDDIDFDTLNGLLDFAYMGELTKDMQASKVLAAADKYEMEPLKTKCVEQLKANLTLANVKQYWQLAIDCHSIELKTAVIDFIGKNFDQLQGDFVVRCQEKDINVTKEMLRKSPVLATMLAANLSETLEGILHVKDFDYDTIKTMLIFLFIDELVDDVSDSAKLLAAAEKYQIDRLKQLCVDHLLKNVSLGNACEMLFLADLHNAPELTKAAIALIVSDQKAARDTDGWQQYVAKNARLLDDILAASGAKKDTGVLQTGRKRKRQ